MAGSSLLSSIGLLNRIPAQAAQTKPKRHTVKKVSWAPENDLCQVRLFLAEDAPFQSSQGIQDQLQAKRPWLWHAEESGFDYDLPPGFERNDAKHYRQEEVSIVPQTAWRCPPPFVINPEWQVVAGDESQEIKVQCEREVRILEAVYPRPSAIPPNPAEPPEPQEEYDNSEVPLIPLIPIEEDDTGDFDNSISSFSLHESLQSLGASGENSGGLSQSADNTAGPWMNSSGMPSHCDNLAAHTLDQPRHTPTSLSSHTTEPDIIAAAAAAIMALMRSNEEGSMIDRDLLIKILSNPQIIETLIAQHSKNNNTLMESAPTSSPINKNPNGIESPNKVEQELRLPIICKPKDALQVTQPVLVGGNKTSGSPAEIPFSRVQGFSHPPTAEAQRFGSGELQTQQTGGSEFINSRLATMPMSSLGPTHSTGGQASSQYLSRPVVVHSTTTTHVGSQIAKGAPNSSQTMPVSSKCSGSQDEQYYKNLIQQHGGPNKDNINPSGFQYRKDLIQKHGGQQGFERGPQLQYSNNERVGGQFANNERSCSLDASRPKFRKPCIYFNTPKGCRRGTSCTFLHEYADRPRVDESDMQHTKRAKVEIEASGRN